MLDICIEEFDNLDLIINIKKSMCMRIGKKHNESIAPVVIKDQPLEWKKEMRYLGVFIVSGNSFKCNFQIARQKFFRALNAIFARIGTKTSPYVILSLVRSYCLPVLLYGIEALTTNAKLLNCLDNAFRTIFAKIFLTFDKNVLANCQFFCGVLPLCYTLDCRAFTFYKRLKYNANECVNLHFMRTGNKIFEHLLKKYDLPLSAGVSNLRSIMWTEFENSLVVYIVN